MRRDELLDEMARNLKHWPTPDTLRAEMPMLPPSWLWDCPNGRDVMVMHGRCLDRPITQSDWQQECETPDPAPEEDAGAHYRREYRGIKLDPYRIAKIYAMQGGPREQIMKKCLRFTDKGQTEQQVVNEIRTALNRWQEMLEEDDA